MPLFITPSKFGCMGAVIEDFLIDSAPPCIRVRCTGSLELSSGLSSCTPPPSKTAKPLQSTCWPRFSRVCTLLRAVPSIAAVDSSQSNGSPSIIMPLVLLASWSGGVRSSLRVMPLRSLADVTICSPDSMYCCLAVVN